jgi:hypothetical protein
MLRRPEGATVDEVVRATAWQRHTVRGVFLVRQFEEILNIWPQFASKVASASMEELRRERPRPRAADDFSTIRARMEELRQIILRKITPLRRLGPGEPPIRSARYGEGVAPSYEHPWPILHGRAPFSKASAWGLPVADGSPCRPSRFARYRSHP